MKRWLPSPWMSFTLLLVWLLLNQSIEPARIVLGDMSASPSHCWSLTCSPVDIPDWQGQ